jgi:DNA-binding GntR family transcriptional regulator
MIFDHTSHDPGNRAYIVGVAKSSALASIPTWPKLGDEAARLLRDAIMSGTYQAGERLMVADLAKQFGVSTMPIREALISLSHEGLVVGLPRRGFQVARVGLQDVDDIFSLHAFIAGLLAERACAVIQADTLSELRRLQEVTERVSRTGRSKSERAARIEQANYVFHATINRLVDAERLRWFLRTTTRYVPRRFYETIPGWFDITLLDHPEILSALESKNGPLARELMSNHVLRGAQLVSKELRGGGFWTNDGAPVLDAAAGVGRGPKASGPRGRYLTVESFD